MTIGLLFQMLNELRSEVRGIGDRLRDLERAEQERKLARGDKEPITQRTAFTKTVGAGDGYYNGKPRQ